MHERGVVALDVMHRAAHARKTFAEAEIVRGIGFGRFAFGPIPIAAVLQIDYENGMAGDNWAASLNAQIIDATQRFFKNLAGWLRPEV